MRRTAAILLVSAFSFSLIAPALLWEKASALPECCRRNGMHHCAMMDMDHDAQPSSGPLLKAQRTRCPFFPKSGAVIPHNGWALAPVSPLTFAAMPRRPDAQSEAEAGYRISLGRSHQKRGPPALLS